MESSDESETSTNWELTIKKKLLVILVVVSIAVLITTVPRLDTEKWDLKKPRSHHETLRNSLSLIFVPIFAIALLLGRYFTATVALILYFVLLYYTFFPNDMKLYASAAMKTLLSVLDHVLSPIFQAGGLNKQCYQFYTCEIVKYSFDLLPVPNFVLRHITDLIASTNALNTKDFVMAILAGASGKECHVLFPCSPISSGRRTKTDSKAERSKEDKIKEERSKEDKMKEERFRNDRFKEEL